MSRAFKKIRFIPLALIVVFLAILPSLSSSYKLNVPKVLLPYHSSKLITFTLEAKTDSSEPTDDLCFVWSSSRPDIVSIKPIYDKDSRQRSDSEDASGNECSSKALVSAVSKHPQRYASIILARETKSDKLIRCDVIVDKIDTIRIRHTTTHLYLEDSPESFTVEALDDEGNTFSSIDGLPFEYSIITDQESEQNVTISDTKDKLDSRNILRLSKFIESEYAVSESIRQLESIGLSGHKILIEGLKTGMANVQAKLIDSNYKETMKTPLVRLLVVANILLEPSHTVYLITGATVKYNVFLIKQTSIEKINLPSLQYYFESRNTSTAGLLSSDQSGSTIIGRSIGSTEIVLTDRNMKEDIYIDLPPPTALVHVVQPDHLVFSIKNWRASWILEVGRTYEIMVHIYNEHKQEIFASDNLNIRTIFKEANFRLDHQSRNGSYHIVTGLQKGLTQAKASLFGTFNPDESVNKFDYIVRAEQDIELLDPIDLTPKLLIFARQVILPTDFYTAKSSYEVKLTATGGSDSYYWQTRNSTIANVNSQGLVRTTATQVGHTSVIVTDTRNIDIQAKSLVYVLDPIDLQIHPCPVETQAGTKLYLNVKMNALRGSEEDGDDDKPVVINDCSRMQFEVNIGDESVFKLVSVLSPFAKSGQKSQIKDACAVLVLDAISVGRTSIKLSTIANNPTVSAINDDTGASSLIQLTSNDLQIGSYTPLQSYKKQLVLNQGSSILVHLFDGPLFSSLTNNLNPSNSVDSIQSSLYETKTGVSDDHSVQVTPVGEAFAPNRYTYLVKCLKYNEGKSDEENFSTAKFSVWHKNSQMNSCPIQFDYEIKIRCAQPHSLHLNQLLVNNEENSSEMLDKLKWKCPIKLSSNLAMAHLDRPFFVEVQARDSLHNIFDNFTSSSTSVEWKVADKRLLEKSTNNLDSLEMSVDKNSNGVQLMINDTPSSQRVYYQMFDTKSKRGETKLTATMSSLSAAKLSTQLNIHFVADVKVEPETLTIFNHPSNVVSLSLANGSGYFHAEVETIKTLINEQSLEKQARGFGNVLKINHISASGVVVSPLVNNGLTHLHVFDYCVPPVTLQQKIDALKREGDSSIINKQLVLWQPSTMSKIQVAGINSIVANYEDDKLEVKKHLKIYVQISDATGTLIKTNYFSLMNLNAKLTINSESGFASESLATILPAPAEDYASSLLKEEEKEYTAIFILNAHRTGMVSVQFEAHSDGYATDNGSHGKAAQTIHSHLKEIQIYAPLNVQPKYVELVQGSFYQITTTGGPMLTDAAIHYEITQSEFDENESNNKEKKILKVSNVGIINALHVGQVRVVAKSVGTNKKQRVYSEDHFVVRVVRLHSVQLQVPLKSIKLGNEMPVFVMANERKLTPLNFGSSPNLRYLWKINDKQIGSLADSMHDIGTTSQIDDYSQFDSQFSLRFKALKPGTVKISIRVEITDYLTGQITYLKDSIEVSVIDTAYFTHLSPAYYAFKYGLSLKQSPTINQQTILMTPGSQFQVKTNLDKSAFKLNFHYQLSFFPLQGEDNLLTINKHCNNNTVQVSQDGLVITKHFEQQHLKNAKQCIVSLLVSVYVNEQHVEATGAPIKQQTLVYTIKVKPVFYSMLRLRKLTKAAGTVDNGVTFSNNVQMKWHLNYYDDLGDMFDVINTNAKYSMSRNDLVDFSQLNKNLFVFSPTIGIDPNWEDNGSQRVKLSNAYASMSVLANAAENSFLIRTLKPGKFIMELTPSSAYNQFESRDYFSISIDENSIGSSITDNRHFETRVGDIICLLNNDYQPSDTMEFCDTNDNYKTTDKRDWYTEPENILQLITSESQDSMVLGLCRNQGKTMLRKYDHLSTEVVVNPVEQVKFFPTSVKYITNTPHENLLNAQKIKTTILTSTSNLIQFQSVNSFYSQNCSDSFETAFQKLNFNENFIPFKCSASLYTADGKRRLGYLDQLITTKMLFLNRHWTCDVRFVSNSNSLLYDLIDSNQEQIVDDENKMTLIDNEPVMARVRVETKQEIDDALMESIGFEHELPFIPAFHVQTKQIQLPINRNTIYIQSLKSKNLKEFSLNEHFNLILFSTRQLYSHLILTTNCPSLIQIKPLLMSRVSSSASKLNNQQYAETTGSILKITYDITTSNDLFDLNTYAAILQEQKGHLYVQISNTLTQQVERVPLKFIFGMNDGGSGFKPPIETSSVEPEPWFFLPFNWIINLSVSQVSSYLFMVILTLITILTFLKLKSPTTGGRSAADQMALNASAAAAAAVAACQRSPNIKETSSFNPYRYFSPTAEPDYLRSRDTSQVNQSPFNKTIPFQRQSPQQQHSPQGFRRSPNVSNLGESIMSPQRFNKFMPMERQPTRLFSVNSDVPNVSYTSFDHQTSRCEDDERHQSF